MNGSNAIVRCAFPVVRLLDLPADHHAGLVQRQRARVESSPSRLFAGQLAAP
ncbi:hypothetical protein [Carbonactinospora thermoautotrophica]|uniref:hypothetical protein n=1 Tax=Carbonactinospora thermoautotrophica TaxID=1469144 RepID=UPI00226E7DA6|nr:hypothetical protein [Carbonactinospora thermoautotrophica]